MDIVDLLREAALERASAGQSEEGRLLAEAAAHIEQLEQKLARVTALPVRIDFARPHLVEATADPTHPSLAVTEAEEEAFATVPSFERKGECSGETD